MYLCRLQIEIVCVKRNQLSFLQQKLYYFHSYRVAHQEKFLTCCPRQVIVNNYVLKLSGKLSFRC